MNKIEIVIQSKDTPKDLYRKGKISDGLTVAIMEKATESGQMAVEFLISIDGHVTSAVVTENNFESLMGAFLGARAMWGRLPKDEFELVRYYVGYCVDKFVKAIPDDSKFTKSEFADFLRDKVKI